MKLRFGERLKNIVLTLLIILSLIQVGILWNYYNHGFPINFIYAILPFGDNEREDNLASQYAELLKPYDIIISAGYDGGKYIISRSSDEEDLWNGLWADAKSYMLSAMESNPEIYDKSKWLEVLDKAGFIFEYKTSIDSEIFNRWVLNNKSGYASTYKSVYKIALVPNDGVDDITNNMVLYVYDGDDDNAKIYRYSLKVNKSHIGYIKSRNEYKTDIIDKYTSDTTKIYRFAYELFKDVSYVRQDMLIKTSNQSAEFKAIDSYLPNGLVIQNTNDTDIQSRVSNIILGSDKTKGYETGVSIDGAITIFNLNNVYTVYKNGLVDYIYKSATQESNRGNIADAFEKAVGFINSINKNELLTGVKLYISNIEENDDSYTFSFDYRLNANGLPIAVDEDGIKNAIVIRANGNRVFSCKWLFRVFTASEQESSYNILQFVVLLDKIMNNNPDIEEAKNDPDSGFIINEISIGYVLTNTSSYYVDNIKPEWIISTSSKDEENKTVYLKMEEGIQE